MRTEREVGWVVMAFFQKMKTVRIIPVSAI